MYSSRYGGAPVPYSSTRDTSYGSGRIGTTSYGSGAYAGGSGSTRRYSAYHSEKPSTSAFSTERYTRSGYSRSADAALMPSNRYGTSTVGGSGGSNSHYSSSLASSNLTSARSSLSSRPSDYLSPNRSSHASSSYNHRHNSRSPGPTSARTTNLYSTGTAASNISNTLRSTNNDYSNSANRYLASRRDSVSNYLTTRSKDLGTTTTSYTYHKPTSDHISRRDYGATTGTTSTTRYDYKDPTPYSKPQPRTVYSSSAPRYSTTGTGNTYGSSVTTAANRLGTTGTGSQYRSFSSGRANTRDSGYHATPSAYTTYLNKDTGSGLYQAKASGISSSAYTSKYDNMNTLSYGGGSSSWSRTGTTASAAPAAVPAPTSTTVLEKTPERSSYWAKKEARRQINQQNLANIEADYTKKTYSKTRTQLSTTGKNRSRLGTSGGGVSETDNYDSSSGSSDEELKALNSSLKKLTKKSKQGKSKLKTTSEDTLTKSNILTHSKSSKQASSSDSDLDDTIGARIRAKQRRLKKSKALLDQARRDDAYKPPQTTYINTSTSYLGKNSDVGFKKEDSSTLTKPTSISSSWHEVVHQNANVVDKPYQQPTIKTTMRSRNDWTKNQSLTSLPVPQKDVDGGSDIPKELKRSIHELKNITRDTDGSAAQSQSHPNIVTGGHRTRSTLAPNKLDFTALDDMGYSSSQFRTTAVPPAPTTCTEDDELEKSYRGARNLIAAFETGNIWKDTKPPIISEETDLLAKVLSSGPSIQEELRYESIVAPPVVKPIRPLYGLGQDKPIAPAGQLVYSSVIPRQQPMKPQPVVPPPPAATYVNSKLDDEESDVVHDLPKTRPLLPLRTVLLHSADPSKATIQKTISVASKSNPNLSSRAQSVDSVTTRSRPDINLLSPTDSKPRPLPRKSKEALKQAAMHKSFISSIEVEIQDLLTIGAELEKRNEEDRSYRNFTPEPNLSSNMSIHTGGESSTGYETTKSEIPLSRLSVDKPYMPPVISSQPSPGPAARDQAPVLCMPVTARRSADRAMSIERFRTKSVQRARLESSVEPPEITKPPALQQGPTIFSNHTGRFKELMTQLETMCDTFKNECESIAESESSYYSTGVQRKKVPTTTKPVVPPPPIDDQGYGHSTWPRSISTRSRAQSEFVTAEETSDIDQMNPRDHVLAQQKMHFTDRWLNDDLDSFTKGDSKPDLLKFSQQPILAFDQMSIGSASAEIALITGNQKERSRFAPDIVPTQANLQSTIHSYAMQQTDMAGNMNNNGPKRPSEHRSQTQPPPQKANIYKPNSNKFSGQMHDAFLHGPVFSRRRQSPSTVSVCGSVASSRAAVSPAPPKRTSSIGVVQKTVKNLDIFNENKKTQERRGSMSEVAKEPMKRRLSDQLIEFARIFEPAGDGRASARSDNEMTQSWTSGLRRSNHGGSSSSLPTTTNSAIFGHPLLKPLKLRLEKEGDDWDKIATDNASERSSTATLSTRSTFTGASTFKDGEANSTKAGLSQWQEKLGNAKIEKPLPLHAFDPIDDVENMIAELRLNVDDTEPRQETRLFPLQLPTENGGYPGKNKRYPIYATPYNKQTSPAVFNSQFEKQVAKDEAERARSLTQPPGGFSGNDNQIKKQVAFPQRAPLKPMMPEPEALFATLMNTQSAEPNAKREPLYAIPKKSETPGKKVYRPPDRSLTCSPQCTEDALLNPMYVLKSERERSQPAKSTPQKKPLDPETFRDILKKEEAEIIQMQKDRIQKRVAEATPEMPKSIDEAYQMALKAAFGPNASVDFGASKLASKKSATSVKMEKSIVASKPIKKQSSEEEEDDEIDEPKVVEQMIVIAARFSVAPKSKSIIRVIRTSGPTLKARPKTFEYRERQPALIHTTAKLQAMEKMEKSNLTPAEQKQDQNLTIVNFRRPSLQPQNSQDESSEICLKMPSKPKEDSTTCGSLPLSKDQYDGTSCIVIAEIPKTQAPITKLQPSKQINESILPTQSVSKTDAQKQQPTSSVIKQATAHKPNLVSDQQKVSMLIPYVEPKKEKEPIAKKREPIPVVAPVSQSKTLHKPATQSTKVELKADQVQQLMSSVMDYDVTVDVPMSGVHHTPTPAVHPMKSVSLHQVEQNRQKNQKASKTDDLLKITPVTPKSSQSLSSQQSLPSVASPTMPNTSKTLEKVERALAVLDSIEPALESNDAIHKPMVNTTMDYGYTKQPPDHVAPLTREPVELNLNAKGSHISRPKTLAMEEEDELINDRRNAPRKRSSRSTALSPLRPHESHESLKHDCRSLSPPLRTTLKDGSSWIDPKRRPSIGSPTEEEGLEKSIIFANPNVEGTINEPMILKIQNVVLKKENPKHSSKNPIKNLMDKFKSKDSSSSHDSNKSSISSADNPTSLLTKKGGSSGQVKIKKGAQQTKNTKSKTK